MNIIIFLILAAISMLLLVKLNPKKVIYIKRLILPFVCILFIILLIIFSKSAVSSAIKGIQLWLFVVFPSLFPFFVGSELLQKSGFVKAAGILLEPIMKPLFNIPGCGSFAFAMGITSGYPMGAKITADLNSQNFISKFEAERLLAFTNNSGPLFIIGAVAVGMFKMPELGLFFLCCHIAACITVGILFRFHGRQKTGKVRTNNSGTLSRFKKELISTNNCSTPQNFGIIFGDAVRSSVTLMLAIGGFIVIFSVIIHLLLEVGFIETTADMLAVLLTPLGVHKNLIPSLVSGFFEITTGTNMISTAPDAPLAQKIVAASMIIGWAGLSVHAQVMSIISKTEISIKPYLVGKFLQGIIASIYSFIAIKIAGPLLFKDKPAFLTTSPAKTPHWYEYLLTSCENLALTILLLTLCMFVLLVFRLLTRKTKTRRLF